MPLGYADGVPRAAGNRGAGAGRRARSARSPAGSAWTSSSSTSATTPCAPGDEVVLFGPGDGGEPTAQDWADAVGTIHYEIVTRIGGRFARRYVGIAGSGLMATSRRSDRRPARSRSPASPARCSAWPPPARAVGVAASRAATRRVRSPASRPRTTAAEAELRDGRPARPGRAPRRPHGAGAGRRRRAARGRGGRPARRAADRRLRARLRAVDGVAGPSSAARWPRSWPPRTATGRGPGWSSTTSAGTARPGAGRPSTPPSSSSARDLATVLTARVPRGPVVLVGHSMGGMTVMALAALRPELFGTPGGRASR